MDIIKKDNKKPRYLTSAIKELALSRQKMVFISGPRQIGKTTEALILKEFFHEVFYFNWDQTTFRKIWTKNPDSIMENFDLAKVHSSRLLILDEIHKSKNWKQKVKGLYDIHADLVNIIVTGSARLNIYRKGSDSLLGRYFLFRLHPFSLKELHQVSPIPSTPEQCALGLFPKSTVPEFRVEVFQTLRELFQFSGFPEPYLAKKKNILNIWRKGRREKIIKEDLRDLTHIKEISLVEVLISLLTDKVGSPLSVQSLREDLEVSHDTISRWTMYLEELYYFFKVLPYSKKIARSIKKEPKIYFYDWSEIQDEGARFENMIAGHLLKACHFWEDSGEGEFELFYLRNKEKKEVDFLICKDKKPWFTTECKLHDSTLDLSYQNFQRQLNCPHIQVVFSENIFRRVDEKTWVMGADIFLMNFI